MNLIWAIVVFWIGYETWKGKLQFDWTDSIELKDRLSYFNENCV